MDKEVIDSMYIKFISYGIFLYTPTEEIGVYFK